MFIIEEETNKNKAKICILGVGGGGNNALEFMIKEGVQNVTFVALNTDNQALQASSASKKLQLGSKLTKGLGAGANPEIGRRAAVESYEDIVKILTPADMVFITAGMGGGTGTGAAPLVAQAAQELGILTVGIVTTPFLFEGKKRMSQAKQGIREFQNHVDTLIVIPNEKLIPFSQKDTPLFETFKLTDNILLQAVKGIAELINVPGLINLDFSDIKTVMLDKGVALMGRGLAKGQGRATKAVQEAISSPLLNGSCIQGATGMIVNITAGPSLSLLEVQEASSILTQKTSSSADVIVGTVIDKNMKDDLSITVIATGFSYTELDTQIKTKNPDELNLLDDSTKKSIKKPELDTQIKTKNPDELNLLDDSTKKSIKKPELDTQIKTINPDELNMLDDSTKKTIKKPELDTQIKTIKPQLDVIESQDSQKPSLCDQFNHDVAFITNPTKLDSHEANTNSKKQNLIQDADQEQDKNTIQKTNQSKCEMLNQDITHITNPTELDSHEANTNSKKKNLIQDADQKQDKNKSLSAKDKLLLKITEYVKKQNTAKGAKPEEKQINIEWKQDSSYENPSSPFESSADFSPEDLI